MLKGHPKGLFVLAAANMGERFGYYTMVSLFVLYLQENFGWDAKTVTAIYGVFGLTVYLAPLLGGLIADLWLGYSKTITLGLSVMVLGYGLLAIPTKTPLFIYAALAVIALGNGLFKGNLVVLVGNLYDKPERASLRDAAFNIHYMGINIGAFFAPYAGSLLKALFHERLGRSLAEGYNAAFAVAGLSIIFSLVFFLVFRKYYKEADYSKKDKRTLADAQALDTRQFVTRILTLLVLFLIVFFFWLAFQQSATSLTLFAKQFATRPVDRFTFLIFDLPGLLAVIGVACGAILALRRGPVWLRAASASTAVVAALLGYWRVTTYADSNPLDAELYQAFNPIFIVFLTPLVIGVFALLAKRGKEPSSPAKIGIGMLITALAFGIMIAAAVGLPRVATLTGTEASSMRGPYWLISTYFILTVAELFLSPIGLSFVSKVAPPSIRGLMQGMWLAVTGLGILAAGLVGRFYQEWTLWIFFGMLAGACFLASLLIFAVLKKVKAATGG